MRTNFGLVGLITLSLGMPVWAEQQQQAPQQQPHPFAGRPNPQAVAQGNTQILAIQAQIAQIEKKNRQLDQQAAEQKKLMNKKMEELEKRPALIAADIFSTVKSTSKDENYAQAVSDLVAASLKLAEEPESHKFLPERSVASLKKLQTRLDKITEVATDAKIAADAARKEAREKKGDAKITAEKTAFEREFLKLESAGDNTKSMSKSDDRTQIAGLFGRFTRRPAPPQVSAPSPSGSTADGGHESTPEEKK